MACLEDCTASNESNDQVRKFDFTWNRSLIKNMLIDSLLTPIVESTFKLGRFHYIVLKIWEHTKHKGRNIWSLHGAAVKPSCKCFFITWLANSFHFLLSPASVNIFARTLFTVCCKFEVLVLASCPLLGLSLSEDSHLFLLKKCKTPCWFVECYLNFPLYIYYSCCGCLSIKFMVKISDHRLWKFPSGHLS